MKKLEGKDRGEQAQIVSKKMDKDTMQQLSSSGKHAQDTRKESKTKDK